MVCSAPQRFGRPCTMPRFGVTSCSFLGDAVRRQGNTKGWCSLPPLPRWIFLACAWAEMKTMKCWNRHRKSRQSKSHLNISLSERICARGLSTSSVCCNDVLWSMEISKMQRVSCACLTAKQGGRNAGDGAGGGGDANAGGRDCLFSDFNLNFKRNHLHLLLHLLYLRLPPPRSFFHTPSAKLGTSTTLVLFIPSTVARSIALSLVSTRPPT